MNIRKKLAAVTAIIVLLLFSHGCDNKKSLIRAEAIGEEVILCKKAGGIPVRNPWDSQLLSDCIFVPIL